MNQGVTTLLLIRHGQTPNNVLGALDTALPGAGLTRLGELQADDLVPRLKKFDLTKLMASAHDRARLTATPLAQARGLQLTQDGRFGEIEASDLEMSTSHDDHMTYLHTAFGWAKGQLDAQIPGGPDGHATFARFDAGIADALADVPADGTLAIVSHGAMIRTWVTSRASGIKPDDVEHRRLLNTAYLHLEGKVGNWRFVDWVDPRLLDLDADDPTSEGDEEWRQQPS